MENIQKYKLYKKINNRQENTKYTRKYKIILEMQIIKNKNIQ